MSIYNKSHKLSGKQVYSVSNVSTKNGVTTGHITSEMFSDKNKVMGKASSTVKCTGGTLMIDMKMMLPPQQSQQLGKTDVQADAIYLDYPLVIKEGDTLKDGSFAMNINSSNGLSQSVTMNITDRKVAAKESITTTAGTWQCYKIAFKTNMKIKMAGMGIPVNFDGFEWYAPGFGVVKTDSKYGGTEITAIK